MVERYTWSPEDYDSESLLKTLGEIRSLAEYRDLLKTTLPDISVTAFVADTAVQDALFALTQQYSHAAEMKRDKDLPVITLHYQNTTDAGKIVVGGTLSHQHNRFKLRDKFRTYYFDPTETEEKSYDLKRVLNIGGVPEVYDGESASWKGTKDGIYKGKGMGVVRMPNRLPRVY